MICMREEIMKSLNKFSAYTRPTPTHSYFPGGEIGSDIMYLEFEAFSTSNELFCWIQ